MTLDIFKATREKQSTDYIEKNAVTFFAKNMNVLIESLEDLQSDTIKEGFSSSERLYIISNIFSNYVNNILNFMDESHGLKAGSFFRLISTARADADKDEDNKSKASKFNWN